MFAVLDDFLPSVLIKTSVVHDRLLKIAVFFTIFLLLTMHGRSQNVLDHRIDSLQKRIDNAPEDTTKVSFYLGILSNYYSRYIMNGMNRSDSVAFFQHFNEVQALTKKIGYTYGEGYSHLWAAQFFFGIDKAALRDEQLKKAQQIFRATASRKGLSAYFFFKAEIASMGLTPAEKTALYDSSARYAREAGDIKKEMQAMRAMATNRFWQERKREEALKDLGELLELQKKVKDDKIHFTEDMFTAMYLEENRYKDALKSAIAAVNYSRQFDDTVYLVSFYRRLGDIYKAIYNYEKAESYYGKALASFKPGNAELVRGVTNSLVYDMASCLMEQRKYDEAISFINEKVKEYKNIDTGAVKFYYMKYYYFAGNYQKAYENYLESKKHFNTWILNPFQYIDMLTTAGRISFELHRFDDAIRFSDSGYIYAKRRNKWNFIAENELTRFKLDSIKGDHASALHHYKEYKIYSDSFQLDMGNKQLVELSVQYETDQKNNELSELNSKAVLQQERIRQAGFVRNLMFVGSGLLLLLLLLSFNRYRIKQRANKLLQQKQDEINQQNHRLEQMVEEERTITEQKDRLLAEKEWLMKEINHRVKNNLQVVMSLLNTQSSYLKDEAALNAIHESRHRVHAISLIHRKLYQSDHLMTFIEMSGYIRDITEYLSDNLDIDRRIRFDLSVDQVELDVAQAVPMGLIINEAVTNSVKYAFPGDRKGHIYIKLSKRDDGNILLEISDDGIGLPENFNWQKTESLGMNLMRGLTRQLDGQFEIVNANGLSIIITFKPVKSLANEKEIVDR